MANSSFSNRSNRATTLLAFMLLMFAPLFVHAQVHDVQTVRDDTGWRLQVDGEDFFVKGVVWGYSPRGQNYTYNLFGQTDDQIRKILDYDFGMNVITTEATDTAGNSSTDTRALLAGDGDVVSDIFRERVTWRGASGLSRGWGWGKAYQGKEG